MLNRRLKRSMIVVRCIVEIAIRSFFFFQAEDGIRDLTVTGVQTCALPIFPLTKEWTRVGRSLAADVRFDDPTVSRRHALIVRQPDGVRVLDDRSLNGVFVNGDRVEGQALKDGDEIVVGRYSLSFLIIGGGSADAGEREDPGPA